MSRVGTWRTASGHLFPYVVVGGVARLLARRPEHPPATAARMTRSSAAGLTTIPRASWADIDLDQFGVPGLDQGQHGSCSGFSDASANMDARGAAGLAVPVLSGAYIYGWINGGMDQGASISDAVQVLIDHGTCLESSVGPENIYRDAYGTRHDAEAARSKIAGALDLTEDGPDAVGTLLLSGLVVEAAVQVGDRFMGVDSEGVAGYDPGEGNHAVHLVALKRLPSGRVGYRLKNTWGPEWGIGNGGSAYVTDEHIFNITYPTVIGHLAPLADPDDPVLGATNLSPAAALAASLSRSVAAWAARRQT